MTQNPRFSKDLFINIVTDCLKGFLRMKRKAKSFQTSKSLRSFATERYARRMSTRTELGHTERTHWLGGYLGKGAISFVATLLGNSTRPLLIFLLRCFCFSLTYSAACMPEVVVMCSYPWRCWRKVTRRSRGHWSPGDVAGTNICDSARPLNCRHNYGQSWKEVNIFLQEVDSTTTFC